MFVLVLHFDPWTRVSDLATASSKSSGMPVEICRWQENYGITDVLLQTEEPLLLHIILLYFFLHFEQSEGWSQRLDVCALNFCKLKLYTMRRFMTWNLEIPEILGNFFCVFQDPNELQLLERWPGAYSSWKSKCVHLISKLSRCGYQGLRLHYTDNHRTGVDRFSTRFWSGSPALGLAHLGGCLKSAPRFNVRARVDG